MARWPPTSAFRVYDARDTAARVAGDLLRHPVPYAVFRVQTKIGSPVWAVLDADEWLLEQLRRSRNPVAEVLKLAGENLRGPRDPAVPPWERRAPRESLAGKVLASWRQTGSFALLGPNDHVQAVLGGGEAPDTGVLFPDVTTNQDAVAAGEVLEVALSLDTSSSDGNSPALLVHFPDGKETVTLHVEISSSDFEPVDGATSWTKDLVVDRQLAVAPSSWSFKARARGERESYALLVTFHAEGAFLGAVKVQRPNRAGDKRLPPASTSTAPLSLPTTTEPHRKVSIVEQGSAYRVWLYEGGNKVGEVDGDWRPNEAYFQLLETTRTRADMEAVAVGLSVDLPHELRAFIERDDGPIMFASDARLAPFECIQLKPEADGPLLGVAAQVTRCTHSYGSFTAPVPPLQRVVCVRPDYPPPDALPSAAEEETWLRGRFGERLQAARTGSELRTQLDADAPTLLHFAGHADGSPAGLELQDQRITPAFFHPKLATLRAHPVFFLNGCRAGLGGGGPAALSNFVRFLSASCSAIVAPLVSVDSHAALEATKIFYEALHDHPLAEAVRLIRASASGAPDGEYVSRLSYVAFASPSFTVQL